MSALSFTDLLAQKADAVRCAGYYPVAIQNVPASHTTTLRRIRLVESMEPSGRVSTCAALYTSTTTNVVIPPPAGNVIGWCRN